MKTGTPGFIGERLREAREAREITAVALAEMVGVSRQAISQYEKGLASPQPSIMAKIALILNLPLAFFVRPVEPHEPCLVFFRSLASTAKSAQTRSERRCEWLREIRDWVSEFVELPASNIPELDLPKDPNLLTPELIERAAQEARQYWRLGDGPIPNVLRVLERNGVTIARGAVNPDIDALSIWRGGRACMILGIDKNSAVRSRFDAAHELGHLVLHASVDEQLSRRRDVRKVMEDQAHRFAGAFLLPSSSFSCDLHGFTLDDFLALKPKWVMSVAALVHRARDLEFMSEEQVRRLWVSRSRRKWINREPYDDLLPVEHPSVLRRSIELILSEGVVTKEEICTQLPYSKRDIEELADLPEGFLEDEPEVDLKHQTGQQTKVIPLDVERARRR